MTKIYLTFLMSLFSSVFFAQAKKSGESIADCLGAMNLFKSGKYAIQFTGTGGSEKEFANYPSLTDLSDENVVWLSFIAEQDGTLSFTASLKQDYLQMIVFEEGRTDICSEIGKGVAEIQRLHKDKSVQSVGLNQNVKTGFLYPLSLKAGKKILIGFSTIEKSKAIIDLDFQFKVDNAAAKTKSETKIIDMRDDEFAPTLTIEVRDAETREPIIANLTIEGSKDITALYKGSDFYFNISRSCKAFIKCDAEGYFFLDKEESFNPSQNQEIVLMMEPLGAGKTMQIEEIEFQPGTSEFMQGSEGKLRRLRDFMALNADVSIEIQGHVFEQGGNSIAGQRLSEARAKRVMQYLVTQGIDKERMTAVGYGNTKPIYPEPKFAYEEQANRRVEILVK
ncbi:MAG: OmpA family protein [Bacteroidetes bacterium]|nr:MAG: OmpA family protein [Bacteroidota bacterium]